MPSEVPSLLSSIQGSLCAGALGDALGYAVEFNKLRQITARYGLTGLTHLVLTSDKAIISDDTQMTVFTAEALAAWFSAGGAVTGTTAVKYIYQGYLEWLNTQSYEPTALKTIICPFYNEPGVHARRAPGNTCLSALISGKMGSIAEPINNSKGCGGVMRVAPIGLMLHPSVASADAVMHLAAEAAAITHGHPLGYLPAATLAFIVREAVYNRQAYESDLPNSFTSSTATATANGSVNGTNAGKDQKTCVYASDSVSTLLHRIVVASMSVMQHAFPSHTSQVKQLNDMLTTALNLAADANVSDVAGVSALGEGWVAEEALVIAVFCAVRHGSDVHAALVAAINHDGDSDSTGAITGNILGAVIGMGAVEREGWTQGESNTVGHGPVRVGKKGKGWEKVEFRDYLEKLGQRVYDVATKIKESNVVFG